MRGDFEWDSDKAQENEDKHGVSFEEAVTVFRDPHALDLGDGGHADRIDTIGFSLAARLLFVVSTERGARLRLISARHASAAERRRYEEG
ncbi:MAG: BrnT family toxin [Myxococcales bacterium]|nr:BrnT family toxin [Myxococcales bacterium]